VLLNARYSAGLVQCRKTPTACALLDGVTEACDQAEEEFGDLHIKRLISASASSKPAELRERIMEEVATFANGVCQPTIAC
jgi:serine phosphatase RsbU (regulator of sigma subunit)